MKIGYQGVSGSHSQRAAKQLADKAGFFEPEFIPLGTSENVVKTLMKGGIDYGVVAAYNSVDGAVTETAKALENVQYMKVTAEVMPIRHCIFKPDGSVRNSDINKIISHPQVFGHTKKALKKYFPYARLVEIEDTAAGARELSEGVYDKYTGIVCSREAGVSNGLTLMYENIEDDDSNRTIFYLISRIPKN